MTTSAIPEKTFTFTTCLLLMREYQSYDDQVLTDLLAEGDESAFTAIYHRYWKKLFAIAYNRLQEVQTAEDAVHDVFSSLWRNRSGANIESLQNYLAVSVKYVVLAIIKRKEKERLYRASSSAGANTTEATLEDAVHYKRLLEIINDEIELLPKRCQLVFRCSRTEGKPVKQIAEELNISPKTVENQINRAIRHLKLVTRGTTILLLMLFI